VRELARGMRQLAGTRKRYRRAYAAPLTGLISARANAILPVVMIWTFVVLALAGIAA